VQLGRQQRAADLLVRRQPRHVAAGQLARRALHLLLARSLRRHLADLLHEHARHRQRPRGRRHPGGDERAPLEIAIERGRRSGRPALRPAHRAAEPRPFTAAQHLVDHGGGIEVRVAMGQAGTADADLRLPRARNIDQPDANALDLGHRSGARRLRRAAAPGAERRLERRAQRRRLAPAHHDQHRILRRGVGAMPGDQVGPLDRADRGLGHRPAAHVLVAPQRVLEVEIGQLGQVLLVLARDPRQLIAHLAHRRAGKAGRDHHVADCLEAGRLSSRRRVAGDQQRLEAGVAVELGAGLLERGAHLRAAPPARALGQHRGHEPGQPHLVARLRLPAGLQRQLHLHRRREPALHRDHLQPVTQLEALDRRHRQRLRHERPGRIDHVAAGPQIRLVPARLTRRRGVLAAVAGKPRDHIALPAAARRHRDNKPCRQQPLHAVPHGAPPEPVLSPPVPGAPGLATTRTS
jgi:hypothetical protein